VRIHHLAHATFATFSTPLPSSRSAKYQIRHTTLFFFLFFFFPPTQPKKKKKKTLKKMPTRDKKKENGAASDEISEEEEEISEEEEEEEEFSEEEGSEEGSEEASDASEEEASDDDDNDENAAADSDDSRYLRQAFFFPPNPISPTFPIKSGLKTPPKRTQNRAIAPKNAALPTRATPIMTIMTTMTRAIPANRAANPAKKCFSRPETWRKTAKWRPFSSKSEQGSQKFRRLWRRGSGSMRPRSRSWNTRDSMTPMTKGRLFLWVFGVFLWFFCAEKYFFNC
jgi:hypothetical protein